MDWKSDGLEVEMEIQSGRAWPSNTRTSNLFTFIKLLLKPKQHTDPKMTKFHQYRRPEMTDKNDGNKVISCLEAEMSL